MNARGIITLLMSVLAARTVAGAEGASLPPILACEQSEHRVVVLDAEAGWGGGAAILWEWRADEDPGLPEDARAWFRYPSDAKPVGPRSVLTVASGGGVAVVDTVSGRATAYARAGGNPHSAERLPDGTVVTASSTGDLIRWFRPPEGDDLVMEPAGEIPMTDAHGVVWDEGRDCVWALGGKQMKRLAFHAGRGSLEDAGTIDLPVTERSKKHERFGGHDLVWNAAGDRLLLSDMDDLWRFDPVDRSFEPLIDGPLPKVKSLSPLPDSERVIIVKATTDWWSDRVRSIDGDWSRAMPGARFYKARWAPGLRIGTE